MGQFHNSPFQFAIKGVPAQEQAQEPEPLVYARPGQQARPGTDPAIFPARMALFIHSQASTGKQMWYVDHLPPGHFGRGHIDRKNVDTHTRNPLLSFLLFGFLLLRYAHRSASGSAPTAHFQ